MGKTSRFELVSRNTKEILTEDELKVLLSEKKSPKLYIGMTVTGPFHMGYLIPFGKMLDFDKAGLENIILVADIHSALDDLKAPWEELEKRSEYFQKSVELGFPWERKPTFIRGSSFQLNKDYHYDLLKMSTLATVKRTIRAASEVCRMKNPKVSELIYPIMQALDEQYLDVDIQFGGIDQRHILGFAREFLPRIGYRQRVEIMVPLVASLKGPGTKMSASIPSSHIKVYDSEEQIRSKIHNAYCPAGIIEDNPVVQLVQYLVFPIKERFRIERDKKYGGDVEFKSYDEFERAFIEKKVHPADVKPALANILIDVFSRVRKYYEKHRDILEELGEDFLP